MKDQVPDLDHTEVAIIEDMSSVENGVEALYRKKYEVIQEISNTIISTNNIAVISNFVLDIAINYTKASKGSLMLLNEKNELRILAARGLESGFMHTYKIQLGEGIAGTVALNRTPVLVTDIEKDARFKRVAKRDRYKTRSFMAVPLICRDKLLGVININDKVDGFPFTEDDLSLLKLIANQAAIAIENAYLMNQLKAKATEVEELNRKLIEMDLAKTDFITRVSHDLRTPLNSIKGAIYYLQQSEGLSPLEQKEFFEIIGKETDVLIEIVENLIDFLRHEDELRTIKRDIINLREVLTEIEGSRFVKNLLTRKAIIFSVVPEPPGPDIIGDKINITRFFFYVLEVIASYLDSGDSMSVLYRVDESIKLIIKASRPLPEELLALFQNSVRFLERKEEFMKIYIARRICEVLGWMVKAENTTEGVVISVEIPKSEKKRREVLIDRVLDLFTDFISELLDLNICSIMMRDEITDDLLIKSARGVDDVTIKKTRLKMGDRIAGWVALEGRPLLVKDIENDPRFARKSMPHYTTKSLLSVPIKMGEEVVGVLNLNNKRTMEPFTEKDLYIATAISERLSHLIQRIYQQAYNEEEYKKFVNNFEGLIQAKKKYHKDIGLVTDLMMRVLDRLDVTEEEKKIGLYVSLIYDLGLLTADERLLKKRFLSRAEKRTIILHPYTLLTLLNDFEFSEEVKNIILHHHERYDGKGYPDGLKGEEIPLLSRVLYVVDSYCAMISDRPYRKAYSRSRALKEIKKDEGQRYDPQVVRALEEALSEWKD